MASQNGPSISPNLLMNFNPYDILQPQRTSRVEKLIDVGDMTLSHEVDASLLDQKPRYDLIDLFQNLYVTPELVKTSNNAGKTNDTANTSSNTISSSNIDFKDFLDKIESGEKVDWTKNIREETKQHDRIEMVKRPKVLARKVSLDDSDIDEDLIEELLAKKNEVKRILDEVQKRNNFPTSLKQVESKSQDEVDYPQVKVLNAPTDIDLKLTTNNIETNKNTPNTNPVDTDFDIRAELSRLKLNNKDLNTDKSIPIASPVKLDGQINNALDFKLIAIKKDEKVYRKKRIIKPESQTRDFTKGADYDEKSVVLPQMMLRIKARQAFLEERNNQKRRFILDAGITPGNADNNYSNIDDVKNGKKNVAGATNNVEKATGIDNKSTTSCPSTVNTWSKVNPVVLMADCNKERLRAFEQVRMFQNFVKSGK